MRLLLEVQRKLMPDILTTMEKRYRILQHIRLMEPIGRRNLAASLVLSERILRTEIEHLKDLRLLAIAPAGMSLTKEGEGVLLELEDMMKELRGLSEMEEALAATLKINKVVIVPGDSDQTIAAKKEMARACVVHLSAKLLGREVIAVTGGTTMAQIAEMMPANELFQAATFVPARGGLGENHENQANTICAEMAKRTGATYRLLHVPDQLSEDTYQSLISEEPIAALVDLIKSAPLVVHGIGDAMKMARRRGSKQEIIDKLKKDQAAGEAFGYYFDQTGNIIHRERTIGLQLEDLDGKDKYVIAVAGGSSKSEAIASYFKHRKSDLFITDEAAAKKILG